MNRIIFLCQYLKTGKEIFHPVLLKISQRNIHKNIFYFQIAIFNSVSLKGHDPVLSDLSSDVTSSRV
jgi:hypothetical protein